MSGFPVMLLHCYDCKEIAFCRPIETAPRCIEWVCGKCVPLEDDRAAETEVGDRFGANNDDSERDDEWDYE